VKRKANTYFKYLCCLSDIQYPIYTFGEEKPGDRKQKPHTSSTQVVSWQHEIRNLLYRLHHGARIPISLSFILVGRSTYTLCWTKVFSLKRVCDHQGIAYTYGIHFCFSLCVCVWRKRANRRASWDEPRKATIF